MIQRMKSGWQAVARVRVDGRIVVRKETLPTKEAAKRRLEDLKSEIRTGKPAESSLKPTTVTFKDILEIYVEKKGPFSGSHQALVGKMNSEIGSFPVDQFAEKFEAHLRLVRQTKTWRGELPGPHTLNRRIEVARAAFNVAVAVGLVQVNPVTRARFPEKKEIPRDVPFNEDDRQRLLEAARTGKKTKHLVDALNYFLQVPIRKSELVNMRVSDVDMFSRCVRVRNGTTKNDQGAYKPIPPDMIDYFKKRVSEGKPEDPVFYRLVKGSRKDRSGENPRIEPIGDFKNAWDAVRTSCKMPDLRIHDLRHVSATFMVDAGTPEQVVMTVANWKTNMLRTYYHRDPKKALELVKFGCEPDCEPRVNPKTVESV